MLKASATDPIHEKLLAVLSADPGRAEQEFELLQRKLVKFFGWNGCHSSEDLAQETLLRVFRNISRGRSIYATDPKSYFFATARFILKESWKRRKEDQLDEKNEEQMVTDTAPSMDRVLFWKQCLQKLPKKDRELIVQYHAEGVKKTARGVQLTEAAVRVRVNRISGRLRKIVAEFS